MRLVHLLHRGLPRNVNRRKCQTSRDSSVTQQDNLKQQRSVCWRDKLRHEIMAMAWHRRRSYRKLQNGTKFESTNRSHFSQCANRTGNPPLLSRPRAPSTHARLEEVPRVLPRMFAAHPIELILRRVTPRFSVAKARCRCDEQSNRT
jgi:hypothetical protein